MTGRSRRTAGALLRDRRGVAAIEFAAMSIVFLMVAAAVIEISRYAFAAHGLERSVRETLRAAVLRGATSGDPVTVEAIEDDVRQGAVKLGIPVALQQVQASFVPDNQPGSRLAITALYQHHLMLPFVGLDRLDIVVTRAATFLN